MLQHVMVQHVASAFNTIEGNDNLPICLACIACLPFLTPLNKNTAYYLDISFLLSLSYLEKKSVVICFL